MALNVSQPMNDKIVAAGDQPIMDSVWIPLENFPDPNGQPQSVEKTQGTKGLYLASPVDGFVLHGPFDAAL